MTTLGNIFAFLSPILAVTIAVILFCLYRHARKKRAIHDITVETMQDGNTSSDVNTISLPDDQAEEGIHYDRFPPRYSTVDLPPPYSLFDPKLTSVWPGGPPPAYEMYPITLPLAPHHWTTPAGASQPTTPSSPRTHNHPQRSRQTSSSQTLF